MSHAARVLALLSRSVVAVSTKLSIGAVLGLAALPLLPQDAASKLGTAPPLQQQASAPVELVRAKPVPIGESAPVDPAFQLVARRTRRQQEPRPAYKTSSISPAPEPAAAEPPPPSPAEIAQTAAKTRAKPASMPDDAPPPAATREAAHNPKVSAIAPPQPAPAPVSAPEAKAPEPAAAEPPKPETWSDAAVIAALRECVRLLGPIAAEIDTSEPVKREVCGAPAPVMLKRIGSGSERVEINPPAVLNCAMVAALHEWVAKTLQPAAREQLGAPVARLRNASGYSCRARNGHPLGTDRLSEHALANAIDIAGFVTADGRTVDVARRWGPTARDLRAKAAEAAKGAPAKPAEAKPEPPRIKPSNPKISAIAFRAGEAPPAKADGEAKRKTAALAKPGKGTSDISGDPQAIPVPGQSKADDAKTAAEAGFLRRLHKGACGVFGTVLGPEANDLHRDHFHFDLASRRHSALCQ